MYKELLEVMLAKSVERLIRFEQYISLSKILGSVPEQRLAKMLEELLDSVRSNLDKSIKLWVSTKAQEYNKEDFLSVASSLLLLPKDLKIIHGYLKYLPKPKISPQTYVFLEDIFETLYVDCTTISVTSDLEEYSFRFFDLSTLNKNIQNSVLSLPYVEINNPLMWTLLVHEFGHYLENDQNVSTTICNELGDMEPEKLEIVSNWIKELFADMIALYTMGPSYFFAFSNLFLIEPHSLVYGTKSHPAPISRITKMYEELSKNGLRGGMVESIYNYIEELSKINTNIPGSNDLLTVDTCNEIVNLIFDRTLTFLPANLNIFSRDNYNTGKELVVKLNKGIPISSKRMFSDNDVRVKLEQLSDGSFPVYEVLETLQETPNKVSEIMYSSWLYWQSYQKNNFGQSFSSQSTNYVESHHSFKEQLDIFDDMILKSIQTASVHKFFSRVVSG